MAARAEETMSPSARSRALMAAMAGRFAILLCNRCTRTPAGSQSSGNGDAAPVTPSLRNADCRPNAARSAPDTRPELSTRTAPEATKSVMTTCAARVGPPAR